MFHLSLHLQLIHYTFIDTFPMLQQDKYFDGVPVNFDIGIFTLESYN